MIGKENVKLSAKQIDELVELIDKEEYLENEEKIEKALAKSKEQRDHLKQQKDLLATKPIDESLNEIDLVAKSDDGKHILQTEGSQSPPPIPPVLDEKVKPKESSPSTGSSR